MVIEINAQKDTPEEIAEKIRRIQYESTESVAATKKALKLAAFGKVKWDEDPLQYQKRLRDEWS